MKAVNLLPTKFNLNLVEQIGVHTRSNNGQISELAAKILQECIENNKVSDLNPKLMVTIAQMTNGNRALLQKRGRELLIYFKKQKGTTLNRIFRVTKNHRDRRSSPKRGRNQ